PVGGHTPSHGVPGARQPHAESDPCARHHGAFPGRKDSLRNERKAMTPRLFAAALLALPMLVCAQDTDKPAAKPKPAAKAAAKDAVATVNGVGVPGARMEFMMEQQRQRGAPDNAQTRAMLRDELVNREIVAQEAQRAGFAKSPEVQTQLDIARQEILVGAYLRDWVKRHPVTDAEIQKEYDRART